mgnify:CR=1 FL=1
MYAIKGILLKRSEYFRCLFTSPTLESNTKEVNYGANARNLGELLLQQIKIEGVDKPAFLSVMQFLYTGAVKVRASKRVCVRI